MARKNKKKEQGPSVTANVNDNQQEWHTAASDDEEAYANEMAELYKD